VADSPRWRRSFRFWGPDLDADLAEEFRFHLEAEIERLVAGGMTSEAAREEARRRFGDIEYFRQYCRGADRRRTGRERRSETFTVLRQDLRYALRALRRQPTFTLIAALTLGLGIGANTAIFSVVNSVLLTPLPYREPDRLVMLWETMKDPPMIVVSYPDYLDWRQRTRSFEDIAVYNGFDEFNLTGRGDPERVRGALASGNLFAVLGLNPAVGRLITPSDDRPGAEPVAVLSDGFWRRRFGADSSVVGTSLLLDGIAYTVVGVLPPSLRLANRDVWIPVGLFTDSPRFVRSNHPGLLGIGRLKPGVTLEQMRADLSAVAKQLEAEYPADNAGIGASGGYLMEMVVGSIRRALVILSGAVGLVLLIACANVANLVLSRSASREKEFALRIAIGAGRGHLVRQLLTESLVLSLIGGGLAVGMASGGLKLLQSLRPGSIPRLTEIQVDGTVLLYALGLSVLTGLLFGLVPAWQTARTDHLSALKDGGGSAGTARARIRTRAALTVAEVALALVLLVGAGLLLRSFANLTRVDPGVDPDNLVAAQVQLPETKYPTAAARRRAFEEIVSRVGALPGVERAAAATDLPVTATWQTGVTFEGLPPVASGGQPMLNGAIVTPEYFAAMSMRLLRGRGLEATDLENHPPVTVISETVARRYFGAVDPIGQRMRQGDAEAGTGEWPWLTIVGVVSDTRTDGLEELPRGTFYVPIGQSEVRSMWVMVRSAAPVDQVAGALRREVAAIDPDVPLANVVTLHSVIDGFVAQPRFSMLMLSLFAGVALLLAAGGIYGVITYNVSQRWNEIGVRLALGATRKDVMRLVIGHAMKMTAVGLVIGIGIALWTGRVIANQLYEVKPSDPLVLVGVTLFLAIISLLASAVPAVRATRIAPTVAIRGDG
jgi:putative ABC transport system permease protein